MGISGSDWVTPLRSSLFFTLSKDFARGLLCFLFEKNKKNMLNLIYIKFNFNL